MVGQNSEFSPNGKLFALINEHGVLKIWNTETNELKQEYTPNLHLAGPCSCLTWLSISGTNSSAQKKKQTKSRKSSEKALNDESTYYIAMGTNKGGVALYSYALGEVERNLKGEGHSGKVKNLTYDHDDLLYTCGNDYNIICWSISNEKRVSSWPIGNEKPNSLNYLPESKLLVIGARQLKVFSLENQEIIQTFTGHTSDIILLKHFVSNSIEYCLTASSMERILCLWKIGSKGKNRNASYTLLMEDVAHSLSCKVDEENDKIKVAVVTRSGVLHIYDVIINSIRNDKPVKPNTTIQIVSDNQTIIEPIPALAVSLEFGTKNKNVLFAYGDKQFLLFERIIENFSEQVQVLIRTHPKKLLTKSAKSKTDATLKTVTPNIDQNNVEYQMATIPVNRKKRNDIQIPMEARLQNLHLNEGQTPRAQSKVQLLIQALHSKDASLLYTVLSTDDPNVINLTLQRLPVQYVGALVNELTLLMEKKRPNVKTSSDWLKVLIKTHSSQLMALGANDLLKKFGPCIGIIEHRTTCLKDISKLNGRLQLLVSQIKRNTEEDVLDSENCLVYEDDSSSNSDLESKNGSENSSMSEWEEDENNEEQEENNPDEEMEDDNRDNDDDEMEST